MMEPNIGNRMLKTGIIGTIIAAICCFTPALVIVASALGFAALIGYLDYVLFPALAVFLGSAVYGWWMKSRSGAERKRVTGEINSITIERLPTGRELFPIYCDLAEGDSY